MRVIRTGLYSSTAFNVLKAFIDTCWKLDNWMPKRFWQETIVPDYVYTLIGKIEAVQRNDNEVVFAGCNDGSQRHLDKLSETDTKVMHDMAVSMLKYAGYEDEHVPEPKTTVTVKGWIYSIGYSASRQVAVDMREFICTALLILKADIPSWIPASLAEKIMGHPLNPVAYESIAVLEEEKQKRRKKLDDDAAAERDRYEAKRKSMKLEYDMDIEELDRQIAAIRLKADAS